MTVTEVYSVLKEEHSQILSMSLDPDLNGVADLSAPARAKESLVATSSLAITTFTTMDLKSDPDTVKLEDNASPSLSPTLVMDAAAPNFKLSPSPTPPPLTADATDSKSSTPPLAAPSKTTRKAGQIPVQLIGDLPIARQVALSSFTEIYDNNYQYKTLGRSREVLESMTCDCTYDHGIDSPDEACGPYSDCINRLTQVECLEDDCRCRAYCQNQRFQRKQYANIEIVLTEKKGYGLRAEEDLSKDTFIYEYVGDVVNPVSFKKRMRDYASEGIQHFYFMMLQKDEFIDATKSGGIGRFANHSCNPNCYVAKWTVGNHVRMGIFAKRNIQAHEELTFNYNVDRYGHQAQECFCGEPMCVGYIGGKTQTDIATMDDLYLDALGITDENDLMELKGTKKKKGKKIDDPDFMPMMKPITEKEVPKVVQAIRQTTSKKVLSKLLTRIKITEDQAALRQVMRLRGYSLMTNVLEDYASDTELIALALECMVTWPLLNRNKVQDSKVNVPVEVCAGIENETIKATAQKLLDHWATLPVYNRIPKRAITIEEVQTTATIDDRIQPSPERRPKSIPKDEFDDVKDEFQQFVRKKRRVTESLPQTIEPPSAPYVSWEARSRERAVKAAVMRDAAKAIIASAAEAAQAEEAAAAAAAAQAKLKAAEAEAKARRRKERAERKALGKTEDKEANKEKRLMKLVGAVVVKCMSKHSKSFDRDAFKKHAKDLTQIISDKEKKSSSYRDGKLDALSEEKVTKIKKFAKEYIAKILRKIEKSGKRPNSSKPSNSSSTSTVQDTPSTSMHTPNSNDGGDAHGRMSDAHNHSMSVEEAMSMDLDDSGSDGEDDDVDAEDDDMNNDTGIIVPPSTSTSGTNGMPPPALLPYTKQFPAVEDMMDLDGLNLHSPLVPSDPRQRPPTSANG
ncbi:hypothetical protein M413DRAFT_444973 [Hebeloma cylindrosporum]|uniref:Histone-lysine N-methyltransferase, H3 lysine-36 specific n=1 Tax=Hebeloma cylindrosporum TaxID=76867 RepID=A0A0C2XVR2_HEBCY|nr:hypothetical protein M413DRAFT_444973 [Hebeloma cylindrosporum h7]